jgi:hypothetical protein
MVVRSRTSGADELQGDAVGSELLEKNHTYCRMTLLTGASIPKRQLKQFGGTVRWKGFSERLNVDIGTTGVVSHRRILFSTPVRLAASLSDLVTASDARAGRSPLLGITESSVGPWLELLFEEATVDGIMLGPLKKEYLNVLESSFKTYSGLEGGSRRSRKFWNGLSKTLSYDLLHADGGQMEFTSLASTMQNVYVFDLFQYGVASEEIPASAVKKEKGSLKTSAGRGSRMVVDEVEDDWAKIRTEMSLYFFGDGV